jgi:outer membrane protein assembly factor BamD (BamD/ComL family)
MRSINCSFLIITFLIVSCSRMSENELYQTAQTAVDQKNYLEAVQHLEELIDRFPNGKHTEESLFLLGTIYNDNLQKPRMAIETYRRLHMTFPNGEKTPGAMFLVGFIYNNVLHNYDSARIAYEQFLQEYPQHEMVTSAEFEIANLGKSPDELFRTRISEEEHPKTSTDKKSKTSSPKKHEHGG